MPKGPIISILGQDPKGRTHRINANSFQQNAITTVYGWQYVAFYTDGARPGKTGVCNVNLARRRVDTPNADTKWQTLTFEDYDQVTDDGHNTISIGICKGDGTIHMAFDHHCDEFKFRFSNLGAALEPPTWSTSLFTPTKNFLPGIPPTDLMKEVSYPRFLNIDNDILLTYRIGQAGLGSDVLYRYSSLNHRYTYLGQHLTGVFNSPYINGIDHRLSRLHISWCYRNFVSSPPSATPDAHKQQAGPNGPENNHDFNYAFSDDLGETWKNSEGLVLAKIGSKAEAKFEATIKPDAEGARVFEIPSGSGILNQEAQTPDWEGGFFALNRENKNGEEKWMIYHREPHGKWTAIEVPCSTRPTETGPRASICVDRRNNLYLVLPGNSDSSLSIVKGQVNDGSSTFVEAWTGNGFDGEPLIDVQGLEISDRLSIFTRTDDKAAKGERELVVLDFDLSE